MASFFERKSMIYKFQTILKKVEDQKASYIEIPLDVESIFKKKRVKVKVLLNTIEYRGSIVMMQTSCHILGIPKVISEQMKATYGDLIDVELQEDLEERIIVLDTDVKEALWMSDKAKLFYDSLSFTNQKKYHLWITSAKKLETRNARIQQMITMLEQKEKK